MDDFKSFFNKVGGNEGTLCHYPSRLDTYGCGCSHNCAYCYARSLLAFRGLWNAKEPKGADIFDVNHFISAKTKPGEVIRLGGMTDCFQEKERTEKRTKKAIWMLNKKSVHYLIVTKSDLVAEDEYIAAMDKRLAHIQISITSTDAELSKKIEPGAPVPERRIKAVERLQAEGFDISVRLSPYVPEFVDLAVINSIKCDKILVEFLRVNGWIRKWLADFVDLRAWTLNTGGYSHLPLETKKELLSRIGGEFKQRTICEDVPEHWEFWKNNYNYNPNDCCNLSL